MGEERGDVSAGDAVRGLRRGLEPEPPYAPERELAVTATRVLTVLAVPVVGAAAFAAGRPGALGAAVGLGLVLVLFGLSGLLVTLVGRLGSQVVLAVTSGAAFARLAVYALALSALSDVEGLHRTSLALATVVAFVVTLTFELRFVARNPHLTWVRASL